ncbi:MAG: hypothetical protein HYX27_05090 [Acidobacteria bacterium]|nr:hypothetical protein [Acidobacteriota bacterium]
MGTVTTIPNSNTPNTPKPAIPQPLEREDVHRTIALVVDDMKMSFESLHFTREALRKFIAQQLAPGDLVAVLSTSNSTSGPASAVQPVGNGEGDDPQTAGLQRGRFAVGTLGSTRHIAEGMKDMPGRKSVILVSESMRMAKDFAKEEPPVDVNDVRRVSGAANRSAVTIYALDPRSVIYPGLQAADDGHGLENTEILDAFSERQEKIRGAQNTLPPAWPAEYSTSAKKPRPANTSWS